MKSSDLASPASRLRRNRLAAALRWEATLQARHRFYAVTAVVALVWVGLLHLLPPGVRADPAALVPLFVLTNLQITAFYFASALVLLEKGQGIIAAFVTSPLRPGEYLLAKALTLTALGTAENALVVLLVYGTALAWEWLLLGTALLGALYVFLGLAVVARHAAINTFLMPSVGWITLFTLPLLGYYGVVPWWVFAWHPMTPALVLLEAGCRPVGEGLLTYGVLGCLGWCGFAFAWAHRRLVRIVAPAAA
jgi:fluoroquinolone transport system permease protein